MNREIAALYRLPAKQLEVILQQLSELRNSQLGSDLRDRSGSQIPDITVVLKSGHLLTEEVVQFAAEPASSQPILLLRLSQTANALDTCYMALSEIAGVTVHHTSETLHLLAFDHFRPLNEKVPTRLEIERQARTMAEGLAIPITLAWATLPTNEVSLQTLARGLQDLQGILTLLLADDLGRSALQAQVQTVEITSGSQGGVKLLGNTLQIIGEVSNHDLRLPERSPLQTAIERVL